MMGTVIVTPHSADPSAIDATVDTLRALPMAGFELVEVCDGLIHGKAADAGFLKWAAERQGYAKAVEIVEDDVGSPTQRLLAEITGTAGVGHCPKLAASKPERPARPRGYGLTAELARRVMNPEPPLLYNADGYPIRRKG